MSESERPTLNGLPLFRIPEYNLSNLQSRIAKMNKRAAKLEAALRIAIEWAEDDHDNAQIENMHRQIAEVLAASAGRGRDRQQDADR